MDKRKVAFWLFIPFLPYLIPILMGYAWLPVGGESNSLIGSTYPYGFTGRAVRVATSGDPETSSQYNIPYFYELKNYLNNGELPLWNKNAGLGMPYAALGEGSPYSPMSILRAIIPSHYHDIISIFGFAIGSFFFYLLLLELGLKEPESLAATALYTLQGAFTSTILLPNIAQTIALILPLVFWASTRLINGGRRYSLILFALSIALFLISGHAQQAFIGFFVLTVYAAIYCLTNSTSFKNRFQTLVITAMGLLLGVLIASPYLLPIYSYIGNSYHVHQPGVGLISATYLSLNYIFDPLHFQGFRQHLSLSGKFIFYANRHLFYFGMTFFFLSSMALLYCRNWVKDNRGVLIFFIIGCFFLLKFMGNLSALWLGYLPFFSTLTPKHYGGVISFLFSPLAAVGISVVAKKRVALWQVIAIFIFMVILMYSIGFSFISWGWLKIVLIPSLKFRLPITVIALLLIMRSKDQSDKNYALCILIVAEMSLYTPLGAATWPPTITMLLFYSVGAASAVIMAYGRRRSGYALLAATFCIYAFFVVQPTLGLSRRQEITALPPHMVWLKEHRSPLYRSFGIQPSYSSIIDFQDFGTTQPLIPKEFDLFTRLVSGAPTKHLNPLWFHLWPTTGTKPAYELDNYFKYRGAWDFFGLKYLVINKKICFKDPVSCDRLKRLSSMKLVSYDDISGVFESKTVLPKIFAVRSWVALLDPEQALDYVTKAATNLSEIRPVIEGPMMAAAPLEEFRILGEPWVELLEYGSIKVHFVTRLEGPHMILVTDNYNSDWRVYIDGKESELYRANAMVRAVHIDGGAGERFVEMVYKPRSFFTALYFSIGALSALVIIFFYLRRRK